MTNLIALPNGTELVGDYRIERVLGAGGFGITYLADEVALARAVTIKEYFPSDFAARSSAVDAAPRSQDCAGDYRWGLDRFIEEAQTLAKFSHPNIVRVYRYFRANNTGYMVLHFEEGQSLKAWLKGLGRAPRQKELDRIVPPLLDALSLIHAADFLHRDIAPDNIIIRKSGEPVLIDFGSARGEIAAHSKTVSALVKPGYSPYEQYAERSSQQGPWTDIYALGATLYHAVTGKRPPDSPSRMVKDEFVPAREAALSSYRPGFLKAIDRALALQINQRPQSVAAWRGDLMAPEPPKSNWLSRTRGQQARDDDSEPAAVAVTQPLPDVPGPQGGLLDFVDKLKRPPAAAADPAAARAAASGDVKSVTRPQQAATVKVDQPPIPRVLAKGRKNKASVAASPAPAPVAALPAVVVAHERRAPPKPVRRWGGPRWRPLVFKLVVGAGIASAAVAMQDKIPGFQSTPQPLPGARTTATPAAVPLAELKGHKGAVGNVAYTDDGRSIVTSGDDRTLRIWSSTTGSLSRTVPLDESPPTSLALMGTRALTGHDDGRVMLWDLDRGDKPAAYKRNDADVWSVTFAGEPNRFAVATHDWKIALWDAGTTTAPLHVFDGHESAVQAIAFSRQRRLLASGSADRTVKLWNLETLDLERTYRGHPDFVTALAFSPDGKTLASASLDGSIRLWSTASNRMQRKLTGHKGRVGSLAFSPAGDALASAGDDGTVRIWDQKRGRTSRTFVGHAGVVKSVAYAPDGKSIAAAGDDGVVRIWPSTPLLPRRGS